MRTVIQRVARAGVAIEGAVKSSINKGLLVFVGIGAFDSIEDIEWLCNKIVNLRIFDEHKVPNISVKIGGDILLVSQFTYRLLPKRKQARVYQGK